jgi:aminoglycoside 6'-N-acetyltransferase
MQIRFRPLARTDFPTLSAWLAAPHVAAWWREPLDLEGIEARYGPCVDGRDPTRVCAAERRGAPIGLIQRYRMADEADWRRVLAAAELPSAAVGIDYLVGDPRGTGRGLGPAIIDAVVAAVQEANRRSWRALEKAGFTRTWAGRIASADPSDGGPVVVYVRTRSPGACGRH